MDPLSRIRWAYDRPNRTPAQKAVLAFLAYVDGQDCIPSQATIAQATSLGERTVRRALAELEEDGLLVREHRLRTGRGRTSDRYELSYDDSAGYVQSEPTFVSAHGSSGQIGRKDIDVLPATVTDQPAKSARSTGQSGQGTRREHEENLLDVPSASARDTLGATNGLEAVGGVPGEESQPGGSVLLPAVSWWVDRDGLGFSLAFQDSPEAAELRHAFDLVASVLQVGGAVHQTKTAEKLFDGDIKGVTAHLLAVAHAEGAA